jgi:hypothetical protein
MKINFGRYRSAVKLRQPVKTTTNFTNFKVEYLIIELSDFNNNYRNLMLSTSVKLSLKISIAKLVTNSSKVLESDSGPFAKYQALIVFWTIAAWIKSWWFQIFPGRFLPPRL